MELMDLFHLARSLWVVWLTVVFVAIAYWAYNPGNKKRFDDDAMIIFKNDKGNGGSVHG
jgi:cytochrome c oxidase cbb3-type subunit 4